QVSEKLGLGLDKEFTVISGDNTRSFKVAGVVTTGAAEDKQVLVSLKAAQELTVLPGKVGLVQVSALTQSHPLPHLAKFIEESIPGSEGRVLGQIAKAESQILSKVQLLLALVAGLILIASGLVILSTMTTTLLERTAEIGLMKALGASSQRIAGLFSAEIGIIALGGGILGYLLGYILAQFIGYRVFASAISPHPLAFLVTITIAAMVTWFSSMLPLRRAAQIDPAITLRGD
ncbi:MAG: FtsX-like permease family protein, partial [Chloroflexi bacterium]|nr:FtsX-like permease family protein [Chloroflexota bacterium]